MIKHRLITEKKCSFGMSLLETSLVLVIGVVFIIGLTRLVDTSNQILLNRSKAEPLIALEKAIKDYLQMNIATFKSSSEKMQLDLNVVKKLGLLGTTSDLENSYYSKVEIYLVPISPSGKDYITGVHYLISYKLPDGLSVNDKITMLGLLGESSGVYDRAGKVIVGLKNGWRVKAQDYFPDASNITEKELGERIFINGFIDLSEMVSEFDSVTCFDNQTAKDCTAKEIKNKCNADDFLVFYWHGRGVERIKIKDENGIVNDIVTSDNPLFHTLHLYDFCHLPGAPDKVSYKPVFIPVDIHGHEGRPYTTLGIINVAN